MKHRHTKITPIYLRYGIVPVRGGDLSDLPQGAGSMQVSVLFDDEKTEQMLTYDPTNRRFFGVRGWYKACDAAVGDMVSIETVEKGRLYRLRVVAGNEQKTASRHVATSLEDAGKIQTSGRVDALTGDPLNFRGLVYAPATEAGVLVLFGMIYRELGMLVESVQGEFPDAVVRVHNGRGWVRRRAEFELKSANFRVHKHSPNGCDIIICWRHNWRNCPANLEVWDLSNFVKELAESDRRRIDDALAPR